MSNIKKFFKTLGTYLVKTNIGRMAGGLIFGFLFLCLSSLTDYNGSLYWILFIISMLCYGVLAVHVAIMLYYAWIVNGIGALIKSIRENRKNRKE